MRTKAEREQAWLEHRTKGVGGSDMSAILGISKFDTPLDIWLSKTGRSIPEKKDSWAIRKGKHDEPLLRQWFRDLHPELEVRDGTDLSLTSRNYPHMLASLDGYLYDPASESFGVLECKTANSYRAQDWRDNFVEMSMKTLIRRSFKYLPVSVEAKKAVVVDETTPDYSDIFHPVLEQSESERVDAMNAPAEAHADVYVTETNETNETEPADWAEQAADETAEKEQQQ